MVRNDLALRHGAPATKRCCRWCAESKGVYVRKFVELPSPLPDSKPLEMQLSASTMRLEASGLPASSSVRALAERRLLFKDYQKIHTKRDLKHAKKKKKKKAERRHTLNPPRAIMREKLRSKLRAKSEDA